jgi:O-antigen ligase
MKWLGLAVLLAAIPIMVVWLQNNQRHAPLLSGLLGLLLFTYAPYNLSVAPYAMPMWAGYVKGLEITAFDSVALAIVLGNKQQAFKIPFQWQMGLYLFAVLIAVILSPVSYVSAFYVWQLLRVYILFRAVAVVSQDERHLYAILAGLTLGVCFQSVLAGWAKLRGMAQSGGSMSHQNLLGMLTNMVLMPCVAMALVKIRTRWAMLGIAASALALVATASRAAMGIGAAGLGIVLLLALIRRPTARKWGMTGLVVVAVAVATPLALKSLSSRFGESAISFSLETEDVRLRMEEAAKMMITDHPFGVGPNYFAVAANTGGYWSRARVPATRGNMAAHVHNSYLLNRAETGLLGLLTIGLLLFSAFVYAIVVAFKHRSDRRGDILLGFSVSLFTFAVHNRVEWGIVSDNLQYALAIFLGLIAGLSRNIKVTAMQAGADRRRTRAQRVSAAENEREEALVRAASSR